MQVIFQDPYSSLNPRMKVGDIISEPMFVHGIEPDRKAREDRVRHLLSVCGLNPRFAERYPHEMSGGQRPRVGIARAVSVNPAFNRTEARRGGKECVSKGRLRVVMEH